MRKRYYCAWMLALIAALMAGTLLRRQRRIAQEAKSCAEAQERADVPGGMESAAETQKEADVSAETGSTGDSYGRTEETQKQIRVLLCADSFSSYYHSSETVELLTDYICQTPQGETVFYPAGSCLHFGEESEGTWLFTAEESEGSFCLPDLKRGCERPVYRGSLEIRGTAEGLLLVNTLDVETYLTGVVPSEMPAGYPKEALKAQAVCARTYAYAHLESARLKEFDADVDDSVQFQVYNNQPGDSRTDQAVADTAGLVLKKDGELADARYYSTSCGLKLSGDLSQEAVFAAKIQESGSQDYEREEPWYRWSTYFSLEELTSLGVRAGLSLGEVLGLQVTERMESGRAEALRIEGTEGTAVIRGEYEIRCFLVPDRTPVTLQSGETAPELGMLPSAFFCLTEDREQEKRKGYYVYGGGYGHGIGMSQNGAKSMAEKGKSFREILAYYYDEVELDVENSTDG